MESYTIIVLIFGLLIFILLVGLHFVNKIYQYKVKIDNNFLAVEEVLKNWELVTDDILEFLTKNLDHEKSLKNNLSDIRNLVMGIKNNSEGIDNIHEIESKLESFIGLENTYEKISKNKEYLKIKDELQKNKEKLVYAMDSYDKGVLNYNNYRKNKFIYILSKICRIPEYKCYDN